MGQKIKSIFIGKIVGSRNKTVGAVFYEVSTQKQRSIGKERLSEYFLHRDVVNCSHSDKGGFRSTWDGYVISGYNVYNNTGQVVKRGYDVNVLYQKAVKSVIAKKTSNGCMVAAGALWHNADDMGVQKKMKQHAKTYYDLIRNSKPFGIENIAKNAGVTIDDVLKVRKYLFIDKHDLGGCEKRRLDPDYYIAESWRRLASNKKEFIAPDVVLINHELTEMFYIEQGFSHSDAHRLAESQFNYVKSFEEYTKIKMRDGIYDGL